MERNSVNVLHGQITIGTLILQVLVAPNFDLNCNNLSPSVETHHQIELSGLLRWSVVCITACAWR